MSLFSAGDGVKFNFPLSASVINLAMGLLHWKDAYENSAQLQNMYNSIKWPLDYLLKCWRPSDRIYYAQVGQTDYVIDRNNKVEFLSLRILLWTYNAIYCPRLISPTCFISFIALCYL